MYNVTSYARSNDVFEGLKKYLLDNCEYKPKVKAMPNKIEFPQVVFELVDDRPLKRTNVACEDKSRLTFEVNIYAKDIGKATGKVSKVTVAREIERYVRYYLGDIWRFKRLYSKPTPNIDSQVYRITLRYIAPYNEFRGNFMY